MVGASVVASLVVTLAGAWGISEVLGWRHSLNDAPRKAPGFYAMAVGGIAIGAVLVLVMPNLVSLSIDVEVMNACLLPIVLGFLLALERRSLPPALRMRGTRRVVTYVMTNLVIGFGLLTAAAKVLGSSEVASFAPALRHQTARTLVPAARRLRRPQPPIMDMERTGLKNPGFVDRVPRDTSPTPPRAVTASPSSEPPAPHEVPHRMFVVGEQAVSYGAVGGESQAVARATERLRHARDESDLAAPVDESESLGGRESRGRSHGSSGQRGRDLLEHDLGRRRAGLRSHWPWASRGMNSMKRTMRPVSRANAAKSRISSSFCPRKMHDVHLQRRQTRRFGGVHRFEHRREVAASTDRSKRSGATSHS